MTDPPFHIQIRLRWILGCKRKWNDLDFDRKRIARSGRTVSQSCRSKQLKKFDLYVSQSVFKQLVSLNNKLCIDIVSFLMLKTVKIILS
jgi:hypothetical protein